MGADAFHSFYGIKIPVDPDDEDSMDAMGDGSHPLCEAAERVGLHTHNGRMTDGEDYFLYVGFPLGSLGLEQETYIELSLEELNRVAAEVKHKLKEGGFKGEPSIHLQLVAQY